MTFDDKPAQGPLATNFGVVRTGAVEPEPAPEPELRTDERGETDEPLRMEGAAAAPARPSRNWSRNKVLAAGAAGAVVVAVGLGLLLAPRSEPQPKMERITPAAADDPRLQIEVTTRAAPEPRYEDAGRMDAAGTVIQPDNPQQVQPASAPEAESGGGLLGAIGRVFGGGEDDAAEAAERAAADAQAQAQAAARAERAEIERVRVARDAEESRRRQQAEREAQLEAEARSWATGEAPQAAPADVPVARRAAGRPSFNCRYARTRAEMMVCEDPRLAAADRRLARAFRRAVDSGVPYNQLRRQQDRWLAARERAAVSPEAVQMVYEQRIAELEDLQGGW